MVQPKNHPLSKLEKLQQQLSSLPKPDRLIALQRQLKRKAKKVQLKPGMHKSVNFVDTGALGMRDKFPFGKHKDRTVKYIIANDVMWLVWIMDNTEGRVRFNKEVMAELTMFTVAESADAQEGYQVELEELNGNGHPMYDMDSSPL